LQISTFLHLFPKLVPELYKTKNYTTFKYSAKQHSGIIYYISQQSHVTSVGSMKCCGNPHNKCCYT
jgi:hypothetical protein